MSDYEVLKVCERINKYLDENKFQYHVYPHGLDMPVVECEIHWGDWKHEHLRLKWLMEQIGVPHITTRLDEENGSAGKPTGYRAYYIRQLCLTKYACGKATAAIDCAVGLMEEKFEQGNPLVAVIAAARLDGQDGQSTLVYALEQMRALQTSGVCDGYDAEQRAYFGQVLGTLEKWTA